MNEGLGAQSVITKRACDHQLFPEGCFGARPSPSHLIDQTKSIPAFANSTLAPDRLEVEDGRLQGGQGERDVAFELGAVTGEEMEGTTRVPGALAYVRLRMEH
jgi:hypothetical protein